MDNAREEVLQEVIAVGPLALQTAFAENGVQYTMVDGIQKREILDWVGEGVSMQLRKEVEEKEGATIRAQARKEIKKAWLDGVTLTQIQMMEMEEKDSLRMSLRERIGREVEAMEGANIRAQAKREIKKRWLDGVTLREIKIMETEEREKLRMSLRESVRREVRGALWIELKEKYIADWKLDGTQKKIEEEAKAEVSQKTLKAVKKSMRKEIENELD